MKDLTQQLYSESVSVGSDSPKAITISINSDNHKDAAVEIGKSVGAMPYDDLFGKYLKPEDGIVEPVYTGKTTAEKSIARKYFLSGAEKLSKYYGDTQKWLPVIGENISEIVVDKLDTMWGYVLKKIDGGYTVEPKIVGKVYGAFDPVTKTLYIDPVAFKELDDAEKEFLKGSGLPINNADSTMVHELVHTVQDRKGTLKKYPRKEIEGEASIVTEEVTGELGMYPEEKSDYRKKYGKEKITKLGKIYSPVRKLAA